MSVGRSLVRRSDAVIDQCHQVLRLVMGWSSWVVVWVVVMSTQWVFGALLLLVAEPSATLGNHEMWWSSPADGPDRYHMSWWRGS